MIKKILVVDDYADNRDLICEILEDAGYAAIEAEDAESGLRILAEGGFALVLMDVSLPGMNGLQATKIITSDPLYSALRVFVLSARAMPSDIRDGLAAGADCYITKPIDEDNLLAKITQVLE